jgi:hypothetical protein
VSSPNSTNGFIFSITEPVFSDFNYEITIPGGKSGDFKFAFYPNANNDKPGTTRYKGVFKFMTNDPNVGSFQIETVGSHLVDTDNDNISDDWEMTYFTNLTRDGNGDYDNDGLIDINEFKIGTNPSIKDTDSDGLSDGDEDANRNGSIDSGETDPTKADTDNDGMTDGWEIQYGLDPLRNDANEDADDDGFSNITEYKRKTDPKDNNSHPKSMPWLPLFLGD